MSTGCRWAAAASSACTAVVALIAAACSMPDRRSATAPTGDAEEITRLAEVALQRALRDRPPPVRLLGVSVSRLVEGEQLRLRV